MSEATKTNLTDAYAKNQEITLKAAGQWFTRAVSRLAMAVRVTTESFRLTVLLYKSEYEEALKPKPKSAPKSALFVPLRKKNRDKLVNDPHRCATLPSSSSSSSSSAYMTLTQTLRSLLSLQLKRFIFFRALCEERFALLRIVYNDAQSCTIFGVYGKIKSDKNTGTLGLFEFLARATSSHPTDPSNNVTELESITNLWREDTNDGFYTFLNTDIESVLSGKANEPDSEDDDDDDDDDDEAEEEEDNEKEVDQQKAVVEAATIAADAAKAATAAKAKAKAKAASASTEDDDEEEEAAAAAGDGAPGERKAFEFSAPTQKDPNGKAKVQRLTSAWFQDKKHSSVILTRFFQETLLYHTERVETDLRSLKALYLVIATAILDEISTEDLTEKMWKKPKAVAWKFGLASGLDEEALRTNTLARYKVVISLPYLMMQVFYYLTRSEIKALESLEKGSCCLLLFDPTSDLFICKLVY
jgi:hypothetical protein